MKGEVPRPKCDVKDPRLFGSLGVILPGERVAKFAGLSNESPGPGIKKENTNSSF